MLILIVLVENCFLKGPLSNRLATMQLDRDYPQHSSGMSSPPPFEKMHLLHNRDARGYTLRGRELEGIYKSGLKHNNMNKPLRIIQQPQVNYQVKTRSSRTTEQAMPERKSTTHHI